MVWHRLEYHHKSHHASQKILSYIFRHIVIVIYNIQTFNINISESLFMTITGYCNIIWHYYIWLFFFLTFDLVVDRWVWEWLGWCVLVSVDIFVRQTAGCETQTWWKSENTEKNRETFIQDILKIDTSEF